MRLVRNLRDRYVPERFRGLATEIFKFGAVGGVNTAIDLAVLNVLLSIGPIKAKIFAAIVATTASYFMNRHWTFQSRDRSGLRREYVLFFALNGVGLAIQGAVLAIAKYGLNFSEHNADDRLAFNVANALGIGIAMVFRFWAYRTFVFKAAPVPADVDVAADLDVTADIDAELAAEVDAGIEAEVQALEVAFTDVAVTPAPRHSDDDYVTSRPAG